MNKKVKFFLLILVFLSMGVYANNNLSNAFNNTFKDLKLNWYNSNIKEFFHNKSGLLAYNENKIGFGGKYDEQNGRKTLIIGSTLLSLFYWGWAIPAAAEVNNFKTGLGIYLLTSGTGFFVPFFFTKNHYIYPGAADLFIYGGTRGILWGYGINVAFQKDLNNLDNYMLSTSILSAISLYFIGQGFKLNQGVTNSMSSFGDFGFIWGGLIAASIMESKTKDSSLTIDDVKNYSAIAPFMSMANLASGYFYGKLRGFTGGDGYMIRTGGILGGQLALTLVDVFDWWDKPTNATLLTIPLMLGGIALGDFFLKGDYHYTNTEGFLTTISELAGSLIGAGVVYLVSKKGTNEYYYFGTSLITGAVSCYLVRNSFIKKKLSKLELKNTNLSLFTLKKGMGLSVNIQF